MEINMHSDLIKVRFFAEHNTTGKKQDICFPVIVNTTTTTTALDHGYRDVAFEDALCMVAADFAEGKVEEYLGDNWHAEPYDEFNIKRIGDYRRCQNIPVIIAEHQKSFHDNWLNC